MFSLLACWDAPLPPHVTRLRRTSSFLLTSKTLLNPPPVSHLPHWSQSCCERELWIHSKNPSELKSNPACFLHLLSEHKQFFLFFFLKGVKPTSFTLHWVLGHSSPCLFHLHLLQISVNQGERNSPLAKTIILKSIFLIIFFLRIAIPTNTIFQTRVANASYPQKYEGDSKRKSLTMKQKNLC